MADMATHASQNRIIIPKLQVFRGMLNSMFMIYEAVVDQVQSSALTLASKPLLEVYFHRSQVSFVSYAGKKKWLAGAINSLDWNCDKDQPPKNRNEMHPWTAIEEMRAASSYTEFLREGRRSERKIWTALFLTCEDHWQYWGAIVKHDSVNRIVHIYIQPFETLDGSKVEVSSYPQAAQKILRRKCRVKGWKTEMSIYIPFASPDVDLAFGWRKMWEG
jgi:hypothetical protein